MIDKSLRSCSLNGRRRPNRSPAVTSPPPGRRRREVTVELNSGIPLPCFWEQRLDIRTGQMHYRNWRSGETTKIDPRFCNTNNNSSSSSSSEETASSNNDSSSEDNINQYFNSDISSENSSSFSSSSVSSSSSYTSQVNVPEGPEPQVLILAGCQHCYLYLMVPKNNLSCPQCSRLLLDLSGRTA